jgi:hypothetical protein
MSQAALGLYLRIVTARPIPHSHYDAAARGFGFPVTVLFLCVTCTFCQSFRDTFAGNFRALIRDRTVANCLVALPLNSAYLRYSSRLN